MISIIARIIVTTLMASALYAVVGANTTPAIAGSSCDTKKVYRASSTIQRKGGNYLLKAAVRTRKCDNGYWRVIGPNVSVTRKRAKCGRVTSIEVNPDTIGDRNSPPYRTFCLQSDRTLNISTNYPKDATTYVSPRDPANERCFGFTLRLSKPGRDEVHYGPQACLV